MNLKESKGNHSVSIYIDINTDVNFDSFGNEYIPQDLLNKIKDKSTIHNMFRIQADDSIGFADFILSLS